MRPHTAENNSASRSRAVVDGGQVARAVTALLVAINQVVGAAKVSDVVLASFVALLIVVSIYYSIKISELAEQNRKIAQEIAVMKTVYSERGPPASGTSLVSDREKN